MHLKTKEQPHVKKYEFTESTIDGSKYKFTCKTNNLFTHLVMFVLKCNCAGGVLVFDLM